MFTFTKPSGHLEQQVDEEPTDTDATMNISVPPPVKGTEFEHKDFNSTDFSLLSPKRKMKISRSNVFGREKEKSSPGPTPVIVVTDIGADIDDTLALFEVLGASDALRIVAIVTSVNNGLHRGAVTRGFLRLLGIPDESVEILPSVDGCVADCYMPDGFPSANEAALGDLASTPRRIREICQEHEETGVLLFGIASLTPVADAIKIDKNEGSVMKRAIKGVYLQGNCYMSPLAKPEVREEDPTKIRGVNARILPNPLAYNFKNDMQAATEVFDYFQDSVPFTLLGKFAAYKVPIRKGDFSNWTHKISAAWKDTILKTPEGVKLPNPTDLLLTAKRQMKRFRSMNPTKFDSIYEVPKHLSGHELEKFEWFDDLPAEFVCSHPYDPLLGLRMILDARKSKGMANPNEKPLFEDYYVQNVNGHRHVVLGNMPSRHSIPDVESVHDRLVENISKGLMYHGGNTWYCC